MTTLKKIVTRIGRLIAIIGLYIFGFVSITTVYIVIAFAGVYDTIIGDENYSTMSRVMESRFSNAFFGLIGYEKEQP